MRGEETEGRRWTAAPIAEGGRDEAVRSIGRVRGHVVDKQLKTTAEIVVEEISKQTHNQLERINFHGTKYSLKDLKGL